MSLSALFRWLAADWTHIVTAAGALFLGYALVWAAVRASYERVVGRPMPRTRLVLVLDVLADLAINLPGALNRLLRSTGRDPLFLPAPPQALSPAAQYELERRAYGTDPDAPPPRATRPAPPPQSGRATGAAMALVVVVSLLVLAFTGLALSGCPRWDRPRCETPGAYSCANDQPHYCAPSRELTPIGDEPCAPQGRVCALAPDGVASCAAVPR